ncbi:MAG: SoxR reducing system RseC family protein [Spirochaetes bacterium]|nr:SoxR reducing system RseC family protein [Spirochaetota bacterium]
MIERGIVTKRDGRDVTVRLQVTEGCEACASSGACSSGKNEVEVWDRDGIEPAVGETVDVQVTTRQQLAGALLLVVVPLALFAAGYGTARTLLPGSGEWPAILGGLTGIIVGIFAGALFDRRRKRESMPFVLRKVVAVDGTGAGEEYVSP